VGFGRAPASIGCRDVASDDSPAGEVTSLLHSWRSGDERAGEALLAKVYSTLRAIASSQLRGERVGHTLQPTALVHEAYLRLLGQQGVDWRDRAHFFGLAAVTMRRILVDHARARNARKRNRPEDGEPLTVATAGGPEVELLDLDRALTAFAERFPRPAKVVEMRYFAELELEEIAVCLDVSPTTVKRDWTFARAWLRTELAAAP
jgi:RNA polymerase sigma factor (TIGR02999 family)